MYESGTSKNPKAAGVCYNNIANLQMKAGSLKIAAKNYRMAIENGAKLVREAESRRIEGK
jgi:hypothetical protein